MARTQQTARKPKQKKQKKVEQKKVENEGEKSSEGEQNTAETKEEEEIKEEEKESKEVESIQEGKNAEGEETTEPEQTQEEKKETTEENKEISDSTVKNLDFHKARRTLYIHFPPGPIGESGMEMLDTVYQNNGKLVLPQQVCFAAFPSEEIVDTIKPKLEELQLNGKPLTVKYMGAKGTDMDDPCINPYRLKVQGLLVNPDEKLVAKKFPKGRVTQIVKKIKSVILDFNTKEDASEALKLAKGLKFGDKPVRVSYVREPSEDWIEDFLKRKAEREAAESPSKKQKLDEEPKKKKGNEAEEGDKKAAVEEGDNEEEMADGEESEGEGEGEESEGEGEGEDEGEGEGDDNDDDDDDDDDDDVVDEADESEAAGEGEASEKDD